MGKAIAITGEHQERRTLELAGDINVFQAAELHRCCVQISERASSVAVECSQVTSLDIAALQILVALKDAVVAQEGTFGVSGLSGEVAGTIQLAGLGKHLGISSGSAAKGDVE